MSSGTVSALNGLRQNDYLTVALLTVIAYDYVLTLPREIDYIWNKRWGLVTVLFFLVRYCGLYILIVFTLMWSSLLPGPEKGYFQGEVLWVASISAFVVWIGAADLVMMLRVWAIYNRSRIVLWILVTSWFMEIIPSVLTCIMYPNQLEVAITQVSNLAYCGITSASVTWTKASAIPEIINGGVICVLVLFQFVKRVLDIYSVSKRWHFNYYMNLFAGQSILYFLFVIFFNRTAILVSAGQFQTEGWGALIFLPLEYVPAFALTPRFIMSVRALRLDDSQHSQERETGLEFASSGRRESGIVVDIRQRSSDGTEPDDEIPLEDWRVALGRG